MLRPPHEHRLWDPDLVLRWWSDRVEQLFAVGVSGVYHAGAAGCVLRLNQLAGSRGLLSGGETTIRDIWTAANAPGTNTLRDLQTNLATVGGCTGEPKTFSPVAVSELRASIRHNEFHRPGLDRGGQRAALRGLGRAAGGRLLWRARHHPPELFIAQGAELPAIAGKLNLMPATNTSTDFNMVGITSADTGDRRVGDLRVSEVSAAPVGGIGDRLDAAVRLTGSD